MGKKLSNQSFKSVNTVFFFLQGEGDFHSHKICGFCNGITGF